MNGLKKIIYNCHKATYLIDKRMMGKISFKETMELRIHLIGCDVCKIYLRQSGKINEMIRQLFKSQNNNTVVLDDAFKEQLQKQIENRLNNN